MGPGLLTLGAKSFLSSHTALQGKELFCPRKRQLSSVLGQVDIEVINTPGYRRNSTSTLPRTGQDATYSLGKKGQMKTKHQANPRKSEHQAKFTIPGHHWFEGGQWYLRNSKSYEQKGQGKTQKVSEILRPPGLLTQCPAGLAGFVKSRAANRNSSSLWTLRWA